MNSVWYFRAYTILLALVSVFSLMAYQSMASVLQPKWPLTITKTRGVFFFLLETSIAFYLSLSCGIAEASSGHLVRVASYLEGH